MNLQVLREGLLTLGLFLLLVSCDSVGTQSEQIRISGKGNTGIERRDGQVFFNMFARGTDQKAKGSEETLIQVFGVTSEDEYESMHYYLSMSAVDGVSEVFLLSAIDEFRQRILYLDRRTRAMVEFDGTRGEFNPPYQLRFTINEKKIEKLK